MSKKLYNVFIWYMSASFWNFALYFNFGISTVEIKFKTRTYFKSLVFEQHKNMEVGKNTRITINFYKKHCLPVVTWNKNLSKFIKASLSKQVVTITYPLEKRFFAVAILYFWRFSSRFFSDRVKKLGVYFGLYEYSYLDS